MQDVASSDKGQGSLALNDLVTFNLETIACDPAWSVNLIYTPKNACSTLKASFLGWHPELKKGDDDWQQRFNSWHGVFRTRFCAGRIDVVKPYACVTRNPYDRLISAYLDKIGQGRDPGVWVPFRKRFGFEAGTSPSFSEFLTALAREPDPHTLDIHFRPQYYITNARFLTPHFVGRVERMGEIREFLSLHGVKLIDFRPHSTPGTLTKRDVTADQVRLIRQIYARDFEHYDYDPDPRSDHVPASVFQPQIITPDLVNMSAMRGRFSAQDAARFADALRNAGEPRAAMHLARSAVMLEPWNPSILNVARQIEAALDATGGLDDQQSRESIVVPAALHLFTLRERERAVTAEHLSSVKADYDTAQSLLASARSQLEAKQRLLETAGQELETARSQLESARQHARDTEQQLHKIRTTKLWRARQRLTRSKKSLKRLLGGSSTAPERT